MTLFDKRQLWEKIRRTIGYLRMLIIVQPVQLMHMLCRIVYPVGTGTDRPSNISEKTSNSIRIKIHANNNAKKLNTP